MTTDLSRLRAARTRTAGRLRDLRRLRDELVAALHQAEDDYDEARAELDRALADLAEARAHRERLERLVASMRVVFDAAAAAGCDYGSSDFYESCTLTARFVADREADLTECRRVLEPLLARPFVPGTILCLFCRRQEGTFDDLGVMTGSHAPECPVRRADALLGRGAGQPGEEE